MTACSGVVDASIRSATPLRTAFSAVVTAAAGEMSIATADAVRNDLLEEEDFEEILERA